jgi:LmbE family N-acetylglucosaminyl deacetylase
MTKYTRRQLLSLTVPATLAATVGFSNPLASGISHGSGKKIKVIVVGAHPDDPETTCGGIMALLSGAGHEVISVYLTRGEAGIEGKSHEEAAKIRTSEALSACAILKARPEFLGQTDGSCEITEKHYHTLMDLFKKEQPELIFTHWPIDTHRDHRICSLLTYDAWLNSGKNAALYYSEAMTGVQTQNFTPTDYVDITSVADQKHRACFVHKSQMIEDTYQDSHGKMEIFRGMECGCKTAEAFVRHAQSSGISLSALY